MTERLSQDDWLRFALIELSKTGHAKLSANGLAAKLGVSRGSFYWHFRSLDDFHDLLLKRWADLTTDRVIADLGAVASSRERLATLIKRSMSGDTALERAIRSWAITDKKVAGYVETVDARRIAYVEEILAKRGVAPRDIGPRAYILYWAGIGRILSASGVDPALTDQDYDRFADLLMT